ncbi:MAG: Rrf2 family transcriptional regulator [Eubacteriales bacterium]|nr:Rrf2 family transcriptional regulator [Eubacteriales bacterium]
MMISTRGRYALRVMIDLAANASDRFLPLKEIADRQGISLKYLEQIIALLQRADFLVSQRGSCGGYRLKRAPETYTARDILTAAEGSLAPIPCLDDTPCVRSEQCAALPFWKDYYRTVSDFVGSVTLRDLAEQAKTAGGQT